MKRFVYAGFLLVSTSAFGQQDELMRELERRDTIDYNKQSWKKEKQRREEEFEKNSDAFVKQLVRRKKFFDSLFSLGDFSGNNLNAKSEGEEIPFNIRESYVARSGSIRGRASEKPEDFIGGNIFEVTDGDNFVIVLSNHFCRDKNVLHSCTNYSLLVEFPKIAEKQTINLSDVNAYARLGYWHFGSHSGVIRSLTYTGSVRVEKITGTSIKGTLEILFNNSDRTDFKITGDFNLPLIDKSVTEKTGKAAKD